MARKPRFREMDANDALAASNRHADPQLHETVTPATSSLPQSETNAALARTFGQLTEFAASTSIYRNWLGHRALRVGTGSPCTADMRC